MAKIILSINAGSSSVKVSVYKAVGEGRPPTQLAEVQVAGLTAPPVKLTYERGSEKIKDKELDGITSQDDAFKYILDHLTQDKGLADLQNRNDIAFTCHRVVHGGSYPTAQVINHDTYHYLEDLSDLAPLHNVRALAIIRACVKELPGSKNIAYFDSSFHNTMPECVRTYPIDQEIAKRNQLRKYGFHGISYAFITRAVAEFLKKPQDNVNIIALHLGSGASACAVLKGKSVDNTMGLTPLAGLPGATRSGSIDPSLVFHYTSDAGKLSQSSTKEMHLSTAEEILNLKSGWKALTGTTDFGKISASDDPQCQLAFDILVDRIVGFVGSYYVKLEGKVDALVFAGGIGEKGDKLRAKVVEKCQCLGFKLDEQKNSKPEDAVVASIGAKGSKHDTLICHTDEQVSFLRSVLAVRTRL
ncbi:acetate kinase [Xylona heveae TC161]|uniref:Probable acetate kinase n=1 Tax=Xylona heveae (strain CBS 132557 / TC161) TaxID=1328760 RepID=A0A165G327_XYLHT|nr:acetate kinase [Xylona heveae TC161]KZF21683.1 acetate kinase [Xylona heveae TC161]